MCIRDRTQANGEAEGEEDDDDEEEEPGWEDLRLVPARELQDSSTAADDVLDVIYNAMCECACLNPDPLDGEESDGEEGEEGMPAGSGVLFTSPDALSSMSLQQAAALNRFEAMLDASTNGRFDDAEEEARGDAE